MNIKIVVDSSCDMDAELTQRIGATAIPFTLHVDDRDFVDTPDMDVLEFLDAMEKSRNVAKSSCPSPGAYAEQYEGADYVFVDTISGNLSGSYASAIAAKNLVDNPERIFVLNSTSSCSGQTIQALEIRRCIDMGMEPEKIAAHMEEFIAKQQTIFVLGSVNSLMKNGRMSKLTGTVVEALNIKPVLEATIEGEIDVVDKARGTKKGIERLAELAKERFPGAGGRFAVISHVQNLEMAQYLKELLEKRCSFEEIVIVASRGLASLYSVRNGIVLAF